MPESDDRLTKDIAKVPALFTRKLHEHRLLVARRATADRYAHLRPPPAAFANIPAKPRKYVEDEHEQPAATSTPAMQLWPNQPRPGTAPLKRVLPATTPQTQRQPTQQQAQMSSYLQTPTLQQPSAASTPTNHARPGTAPLKRVLAATTPHTQKQAQMSSFLRESTLQQNERRLRELDLLNASGSLVSHCIADPHRWRRPTWLSNALSSARLELHARVVDYYASSVQFDDMCFFLTQLGFNVATDTAEDTGRQQLDSSCGVVAAAAAVSMQLAGSSWKSVDISGAIDDEQIRQANLDQDAWADRKARCNRCRACRRHDNSECETPEDLRFSPQELQSNALRTRFLWTTEVIKLAQLRWAAHAPAQPELPGPPCFRCQGAHATTSCPEHNQPPARSVGEWLTVTALDSATAQIARDVHAAASSHTAGVAPMRCIIVNTQTSERRGHHWFTVAYTVTRT